MLRRFNPLSGHLRRRSARAISLGAALVLPVAASCSGSPSPSSAGAPTTTSVETPSGTGAARAKGAAGSGGLGAVGPLYSKAVHTIAVSFDQAAYNAMIATYTGTSEKDWIEASVVIDGTPFKRAGMRLKGNSSLRGLAAGRGAPGGAAAGAAGSASGTNAPESLPWLIKLDKFVDKQNYNGLAELVVRSNSSSSSLNEAVALELLGLAGLASQDAIATTFSVNGSKAVLRLVIESPDSEWMTEEFAGTGALYKAESSGDWSYRGNDPKAYNNVFDQEAGKKNADLTPLIGLLEFLNNSDDATFKAQLPQRLDIDSFATYLAMQDLLNNFDDIDGPGNNSYLYYDTATKKFTVVPWDYNLAFGLMPGGAGGPGNQIRVNPAAPNQPPGAIPGNQLPGPGDATVVPGAGRGGAAPPAGGAGVAPGGQVPQVGGGVVPPGAGAFGAGGPRGRANVLVQRFSAVPEWQALYQRRVAELRAQLYTSGTATKVLEEWKAIVSSAKLVDETTLAAEAARIGQALV